MTTDVRSAADVAPGDLVEYRPHDAWRSPPPVVCEVVRVGKSSLTIKLSDGTQIRKAYVTRYTSRSSPGRSSRHEWHNFSRLDAHDRWLRKMPKTPFHVVADQRGFVSVVLTATDVRDHFTTANRLAALADWLAAEPSKGVP